MLKFLIKKLCEYEKEETVLQKNKKRKEEEETVHAYFEMEIAT